MDIDLFFAEILQDARITRTKIDDIIEDLRELITKNDFQRYEDKIEKRLDDQDEILKKQNETLAAHTKILSNNSSFIDGFKGIRYIFVASLVSGLISLGVSTIHSNANASVPPPNVTKISTVSSQHHL